MKLLFIKNFIIMNKNLISTFLIAFVFFSGSVLHGQDNHKIPKRDDSVPTETLLPSPGEVLNSLSKMGQVKWSNLVTYNDFYNYKGRFKQSLNLGVRVADAFVALQDKDKSNFGEMNKVIFGLSKELGISSLIENQKNKIQELSSNDDWVLLVIELNNMNSELQGELRAQKDEDIVVLSNVGAFFEGMRIVSSYFVKNYDAEKIGLLNQIKLIEYYIQEIDKNAKLKKDKSVIPVYKGLIELKANLSKDSKVSIKTVKQIQVLSTSIVNSITE